MNCTVYSVHCTMYYSIYTVNYTLAVHHIFDKVHLYPVEETVFQFFQPQSVWITFSEI